MRNPLELAGRQRIGQQPAPLRSWGRPRKGRRIGARCAVHRALANIATGIGGSTRIAFFAKETGSGGSALPRTGVDATPGLAEVGGVGVSQWGTPGSFLS